MLALGEVQLRLEQAGEAQRIALVRTGAAQEVAEGLAGRRGGEP